MIQGISHHKAIRKLLLGLLALPLAAAPLHAQDLPYLQHLEHPWVDSVLNRMDLEQQVSQLFWGRAYSNKGISHEVYLTDLVRKHDIGGFIFFQGTSGEQKRIIRFLQEESAVPLLIAQDAEWGPGMRLEDIPDLPYQMTLGAIQEDSLFYETGRMIGQMCRQTGIHINLAPVVDVNNNPQNPVINYRSFGENAGRVSRQASLWIRGLQSEHILAVAKHFPGHGDTQTDSHHDLPVIKNSWERLDTLELQPFRAARDAGAGGMMSAHIHLPALDTSPNLPSTLSRRIMHGILRDSLGFKGLLITDAMDMKGVTDYYSPGEAAIMALKAGNDIVELSPDIPVAIRAVVEAVEKGTLPGELIRAKCRKVLAVKHWAIVSNNRDHKVEGPEKGDLRAFLRTLYEKSATLLHDPGNIIPVQGLDSLKIASLAVERKSYTEFQKTLSLYTRCDHFFWNRDMRDIETDYLIRELSQYDLVLAGMYQTDLRPYRNFGLHPGHMPLLRKLSDSTQLVLAYFGSPYALEKLPVRETAATLVSYQYNREAENVAAQILFGGLPAQGRLPVSISKQWPQGSGITSKDGIRMSYGYPEQSGMNSSLLETQIDSMIRKGLEEHAFPGCQILVARKGRVVYHKAYGYHTYHQRVETRNTDLYDLASITKIAGPVPCFMKLQDEGRFNYHSSWNTYWPALNHNPKGMLTMEEILAHQAGLEPWIPFWENTYNRNDEPKWWTYQPELVRNYTLPVADHLYLHKRYKPKIYQWIRKSPLEEKKEYRYSGLAFYLFPNIIQNLTGEDYQEYLYRHFMHPLGAYRFTYNPYKYFDLTNIVPTELDTAFREQVIHGYVHDEGAAMMGGISGNAGLFSTANDLAKLLEMYRRKGEYGGMRFFSDSILREFTSVRFPENENRRGMGFDKPLLDNEEVLHEEAYPTKSVSPSSYGHSGFTGTFAWVDPQYELVYVFLSNSVHPTRSNSKLLKMNLRTNILEAAIQSIEE